MLPTFVHDYRLTSAEVHGKYLVEIGLYLEQYYQITGTCVKEEDIFKPASFV